MRRSFDLMNLWVAGVWLAGCLSTQGGQGSAPALVPPQRVPNIVFILADDLGYGDLGCYGQARIRTPNLDRLAAEGMRFTSAYAGSTVCAPSRYSLMVGKHMGHAYIRGNSTLPIRPEDFTVAELLKEAGYHTGLFGKWGLGEENTPGAPDRQGFEDFLGYLDQTHAHDYYTDRLWRRDSQTGFRDWQPFVENAGGRKELYVHDLFTVAALNFLKLKKPDPLTGAKPFFLYLAYTIPHANNEEGRRSGNGMEIPSDEPYTKESWPQPEKNKAAMIGRLDADVGKVLDRLKSLGLDRETIVFFSSDNGPHKEGGVDPMFHRSSGPLRGIKRDLYEGGIRVPFIVRWPGKIQAGAVSDLPIAFWDFLPTAADLAKVKAPKDIDGISFLPTLTGQPQTNRHEFLYWEFHERGFQQALRMGDWKAVRPQAGAPLELYNLKTDPAETNNVAAANPGVVGRAEEHLKQARTDSAEFPVRKPGEKKAAAKKG